MPRETHDLTHFYNVFGKMTQSCSWIKVEAIVSKCTLHQVLTMKIKQATVFLFVSGG